MRVRAAGYGGRRGGESVRVGNGVIEYIKLDGDILFNLFFSRSQTDGILLKRGSKVTNFPLNSPLSPRPREVMVLWRKMIHILLRTDVHNVCVCASMNLTHALVHLEEKVCWLRVAARCRFPSERTAYASSPLFRVRERTHFERVDPNSFSRPRVWVLFLRWAWPPVGHGSEGTTRGFVGQKIGSHRIPVINNSIICQGK